jgi:tellurite resistance protein TerC
MRVLRQAAVLVGGALLLAVGAVMLFLPGPGVAVMFAGLALLATEYRWARRWLERARGLAGSLRSRWKARG